MDSDLELELIHELQTDSRQSNAVLASKLGASESTIRRRIAGLVARGLIKFTVVLNPQEAGFILTAFILIDTLSDKTEEVADKLAKISNLSSVFILASNHDIVIVGYFKSIDDLWKVVNEQIIKIPGVIKTETSIALKRVKRAY